MYCSVCLLVAKNKSELTSILRSSFVDDLQPCLLLLIALLMNLEHLYSDPRFQQLVTYAVFL